MKLVTTTSLALALLGATPNLIANELSIKSGYISVFTKGDAPNNNKTLFAGSYQADFGGMSVILEAGATSGDDSNFANASANVTQTLVDHERSSESFQFVNLRVPFVMKLQEKDLTFAAGPSLLTYQTTQYSVNSEQTGYDAVTSRNFSFGLSTEVNLNLIQTKAFGVDIFSTLPINFHSDFGAGFSFGGALAIDL